jgi:hypothetical protein
VNFHDTYVRSGLYRTLKLPGIRCWDQMRISLWSRVRLPARSFCFRSRSSRPFRHQWNGTLLTGLAAAVIGGLFPVRVLGELVSIGILLAFITVCIGVLASAQGTTRAAPAVSCSVADSERLRKYVARFDLDSARLSTRS